MNPLPFRGGAELRRRSHPPPSPLRVNKWGSKLPPPQTLWACWKLLESARDRRDPLALDLPERRVTLDDEGSLTGVALREQLDAHQVVEDFMIAANVAAAKALEEKKSALMYRVHETPSREKLVALKDYLKTFDIEFALGQVIKPATFNAILDKVTDAELRPQIMESVLRSQTQAFYTPQNAGHFGLSLGSYAHFTSPIRRYADLIVHRALVSAYDLEMPAPKDKTIKATTGLSSKDFERLDVTAETISRYERRAMEAERETVDRYVAAYLSAPSGRSSIRASPACRISDFSRQLNRLAVMVWFRYQHWGRSGFIMTSRAKA